VSVTWCGNNRWHEGESDDNTANVRLITLGRVGVTISAVENAICVCVRACIYNQSSLNYPPCKSHLVCAVFYVFSFVTCLAQYS
jgi:hypothetical protein